MNANDAQPNPPREGGFRSRVLLASLFGRLIPSRVLLTVVALLTTLLVISSAVAHYLQLDVLASLSYVVNDWDCAGGGIGVHCFGDYSQVVDFAFTPNPWNAGSNYPAAGMLPQLLFGSIGRLFGNPLVGIVLYLGAMAIAMSIPAAWATRGKPATIRIAVVAVFGVASIPAFVALDRGNGVGFAVPALLAVLIGFGRLDYRLAMFGVVFATLVKPQYIVVIALFLAVREWRFALRALAAIGITNLIAYLAWPRDFPMTILQSFQNITSFGGSSLMSELYPARVSYGRGIYALDTGLRSLVGEGPSAWFATYSGSMGTLFAAISVVALVVAGKRIPVVMAAAIVMASASLFTGTTYGYYLVFGLAVAAVMLRDPMNRDDDRVAWHGTFDREQGGFRATAVVVAIAVALTVGRVLLPNTNWILMPGAKSPTQFIATSADWIPLAWMLATAMAILTAARSRARDRRRALS